MGNLDASTAIYRHLAKDCKRPKKERDTRKYYKCE